MADDKTNTGEPDRSRINMSEPYEVSYWREKFGVSRERLQQAVDKVGSSADAVERELGG